jgi:hypothetical protein
MAKTKPEKTNETIEQVKADESGTADAVAMKEPGFLLDIYDPFAAAVARLYAKAKGKESARLPLILAYSDPDTIPALESYIQRAAGGGDKERAAKAKATLEKIKK